MDLGQYMKKGRTSQIRVSAKKCLNCGSEMEKKESYLYYQNFCSEECKKRYLTG